MIIYKFFTFYKYFKYVLDINIYINNNYILLNNIKLLKNDKIYVIINIIKYIEEMLFMKTYFFRNMLSTILHLFLVFIPIFGIILIIHELHEIFVTGYNFKKIALLIIGIIYLVGCFLIVFNLIKIIFNIDEDPFVRDNVRRLKIIGYLLLANAVFELVQPLDHPSMRFIATDNYGLTPEKLIYFIIASVCFVIAEVFDKAIKIKEENDLTI